MGTAPYINPAPPVIIMFLTSGNGSYLVLPVKTGASFHTPKSSKNLFAPVFESAGAAKKISSQQVWNKLKYAWGNKKSHLLGGAPFDACLFAIAIGRGGED